MHGRDSLVWHWLLLTRAVSWLAVLPTQCQDSGRLLEGGHLPDLVELDSLRLGSPGLVPPDDDLGLRGVDFSMVASDLPECNLRRSFLIEVLLRLVSQLELVKLPCFCLDPVSLARLAFSHSFVSAR